MGVCASAEEAVNPLRVDDTHFEMYRVVGRGAFGRVNAVKHRGSGELMAMKRCFKDVVLREKSDIVVWQERTIMASIHSPFLVSLRYSFQSPVELFLVMDFMPGGDLHYHLSQRRIGEAAARFYLAEVVLGLQELHSLGYVYRDLKPANVLMDARGHVRVSDFGLAKLLSREKKYLHSGYAGTRGYMAPEMVSGGKYTFGADFFSLGAVAFELLTGRRAFKSDDDVLDREVTADTVRDEARGRPVSDAAADFVAALLTKNPMERLGFSRRPGGGWSRVKAHPFFEGVDWRRVEARADPPPFTPPAGIANCSAQYEAEDQLLNGAAEAASRKARLTADEQDLFAGFSYNTGLFDDNAAALTPAAAARGRGGTVSVGRAASVQGTPSLLEEHKEPPPSSSRPGSVVGTSSADALPHSESAPECRRYESHAPTPGAEAEAASRTPGARSGRRRSVSEYLKDKFGRTPSRVRGSGGGSGDAAAGTPASMSRTNSNESFMTPGGHHRKGSAVDEMVRRQIGVYDDDAETAGPQLHLGDDEPANGDRDAKSVDLGA